MPLTPPEHCLRCRFAAWVQGLGMRLRHDECWATWRRGVARQFNEAAYRRDT